MKTLNKLAKQKPDPVVTNDDHSAKLKKTDREHVVFPASITELYAPNEYTSSGGIFSDSQALKTCHQNKLITGKCSPPCYDVVPGDLMADALYIRKIESAYA